MAMFDPRAGFQEDGTLAAQQAALTQREQLLQALQQQNMQAPIVGEHGLAQALMKIGTSWLNSRAVKKTQEASGQLAGKVRSDLAGALGNYTNLMSGQPGQVMDDGQAQNLMQNNVVPPLADPVAANPRAAVLSAMTSQHPELQKVGQLQMQADIAKAAQKPVKGFEDKMGQDGTIVRVYDDGRPPESLGNYAKKPAKMSEPFMMKGPNGPILVQRNEDTGAIDSIDKAARVTSSSSSSSSANPVMHAQGKGMDEWAKLAAKTVSEMNTAGRSAIDSLRTLDQMERINKAGINGGPVAPAGVWLGELATSMGVPVDQKRLSNAKDFDSLSTQAWMAMMNSAGGARGLVKEESEKLAKSLPSLSQTPEGRAQILRTTRARQQQIVEDARTSGKEFGEALRTNDPGKFTYGLSATQLSPTSPETINVQRPVPSKAKIVWDK